jgi:hypothetical protein
MSIGPDITEVIQELGVPITVINQITGVETEGEKFDFDDSFFDSATELIRQFAHAGSLQHNTVAQAGDILDILNKQYLIITLEPTLFEGQVVTQDAFLYGCNVQGTFRRPSGTVRNSKQELVDGTTILKEAVYGCQYERSVEIKDIEEVFRIPNHSEILYTTAFQEVRVGDRWYPNHSSTDTYLKVVHIHERRFDGCIAVYLDADEG